MPPPNQSAAATNTAATRLPPSLLPLHERLPALLHAGEIRGVLHKVDMMLDDAPQNVCDPCCGELQEAQDHEEAVDAPDGENRRACEGDIEHGHGLCEDEALTVITL